MYMYATFITYSMLNTAIFLWSKLEKKLSYPLGHWQMTFHPFNWHRQHTFPQPGGPQKMRDGTLPDSSMVRRIAFFPITFSCPTKSAMEDGLITSARGALSSLLTLCSVSRPATLSSQSSPLDCLVTTGTGVHMSFRALAGGGFVVVVPVRWGSVWPNERSDCLLEPGEGELLFLSMDWTGCGCEGDDGFVTWVWEIWRVRDAVRVDSAFLGEGSSACNSLPPGRRQMSMWLLIASSGTSLLQTGQGAVASSMINRQKLACAWSPKFSMMTITILRKPGTGRHQIKCFLLSEDYWSLKGGSCRMEWPVMEVLTWRELRPAPGVM